MDMSGWGGVFLVGVYNVCVLPLNVIYLDCQPFTNR